MVFNATFNNISCISWRSVLLVEETRVSTENHLPVASHWNFLSHNVVSSTPHLNVIRTHIAIVVIDTDCIGSGKSNYHRTEQNRICIGLKSIYKGLLPKQHIKYKTK